MPELKAKEYKATDRGTVSADAKDAGQIQYALASIIEMTDETGGKVRIPQHRRVTTREQLGREIADLQAQLESIIKLEKENGTTDIGET